MEICLVVAELFLAYRQTDMTKLIVAFRNFAKRPKDVCAIVKVMSIVICYVVGTRWRSWLRHCGFDSRWCQWNFSLT
jgi:hypothetical protein